MIKEDILLNEIKSRGFWRINIRPLGKPQEIELGKLKELVRNAHVELRGWYYPFFGEGQSDNSSISLHNNYLEGRVNWSEYKEIWRIYRSGQFIHYDALHEDWYGKGRIGNVDNEPGKYLNFVGSVIFYITEIMEFVVRLNRLKLYPDGVKISIELHNTAGRQLKSFEGFRHLSFPRITQEATVMFEKKYLPDELVASPADLALEPIRHVFSVFNFADISEDVLKNDQKTLYGYNGHERS